MITYSYQCRACGSFDATRPMGTARTREPCPACGELARRRFTPPSLATTSALITRARGCDEASAHEPAVVTRAPARPVDPRWANLPRP